MSEGSSQFSLTVADLHWLAGADPSLDLCAHGHVSVSLGTQRMTSGSGASTVSAAGLHLMRTVFQDYKAGDFAGQLLPCCGFTVYPSKDKSQANVIGCPSGIDWTVRHSGDRRLVTLTTAEGAATTIRTIDYAGAILDVVRRVEGFYASQPARPPAPDEFEREGWRIFWSEWAELAKACESLLAERKASESFR